MKPLRCNGYRPAEKGARKGLDEAGAKKGAPEAEKNVI